MKFSVISEPNLVMTKIASISCYEDEMGELNQASVQVVFNLYSETGTDYTKHIL